MNGCLMGCFVMRWDNGNRRHGWFLHCPGSVMDRMFMGWTKEQSRESVETLNEVRRRDGVPQLYCRKFIDDDTQWFDPQDVRLVRFKEEQ